MNIRKFLISNSFVFFLVYYGVCIKNLQDITKENTYPLLATFYLVILSVYLSQLATTLFSSAENAYRRYLSKITDKNARSRKRKFRIQAFVYTIWTVVMVVTFNFYIMPINDSDITLNILSAFWFAAFILSQAYSRRNQVRV